MNTLFQGCTAIDGRGGSARGHVEAGSQEHWVLRWNEGRLLCIDNEAQLQRQLNSI